MDVIAAANEVVRQSTNVLEAAAGELAKQDPISWLVGDDEDDLADNEFCHGPRLPAPATVCLSSLTAWTAAPPSFEECFNFQPAASSSSSSAAPPRASPALAAPYAIDAKLNHKISLWEGDLCALDVDAIVAPSAVGYVPGCSTVFERILRHGGRNLLTDLRHVEPCKSGEVRVSKAYGIPPRWMFLTVGPKYKANFSIAAQNSLNACCKGCFHAMKETGSSSIAIPCVWYHQGFPVEDHAHVVLRTARRCMERMSHIEGVVLVAMSTAEVNLFERLMPLYFPRTEAEALAAAEALSDRCFGELGDVVVEERSIRLASHVGEDREEEPLFSNEEDSSFLMARTDADQSAWQRLDGLMIEAESLDMARHICLRYLRKAREVRSEVDLQAARFIYHAPCRDCCGRRVVVLLGARLPAHGARDSRTLPVFVKELELLKGERFVLLYAHSDVPPLDTVCLEALQEMLAVVGARYRDSLEQVLVLHPTILFRATFAFGRVMNDYAATVWNDTVYLEAVAELGNHVEIHKLALPGYVLASEGLP